MEEIDEIMGKAPVWITRYGISCIGLIVLMLIVGSFFFRYPDVINAQVTITTANPPVKIIARSDGAIQQLLVTNQQRVQPGQILCVLANPANFRDVESILAGLDRIDTATNFEKMLTLNIPADLQLGELQAAYTECYQTMNQYRFFITHNAYRSKIGHLKGQALLQQQLLGALEGKGQTLSALLQMQSNRFITDTSLEHDRVITRVEFESSRKNLLNQKVIATDNISTIIQTKLQQAECQKNISETELDMQREENSLQQKVRDAIRRFKGSYAIWQEKYILKTPVAGKVIFFKYWKENQFVMNGNGVFVIVPENQDFVVRGSVNINNAGKVMEGQSILIRLYSYPSEEYGFISGKVLSKSMVPMDSTYSIEIALTNDLVTNYGKVIPSQSQIDGVGEILTQDKSLFRRFFDSLYGSRHY